MSETFGQFLKKFETAIVDPLITLLALGAFVIFVWGVMQFIMNAGNEEARSTGQRHMIWGLVGLVIIFGARAIIALLTNTFGIQGLTQ